VSAGFIHDAAHGYLSDAEWRRCQPWAEHVGAAIDRLKSDAHGIDGLLKHHVPRPGLPGEEGYEITDVLEQRALRARAVKFPPDVWWDAAAAEHRGNAARLKDLGRAAMDRGRRVRGLAQFYGQAALDGDDSALYMLVRYLCHDRCWSSAWRWVERATAVASPGKRWAMLSLVFERDNYPQGAAVSTRLTSTRKMMPGRLIGRSRVEDLPTRTGSRGRPRLGWRASTTRITSRIGSHCRTRLPSSSSRMIGSLL
jgi:hypothetical protein